MLKVVFTIPRQVNHIIYDGLAIEFINAPIVMNNGVVGVITKIISSNTKTIKVEGKLFKAGASFIKKNNNLTPMSIELSCQK